MFGDILRTIGQGLLDFWWVILPVVLFFIFNILWFDFVYAYSRWSHLATRDYVLLEVIPPREIEKSPQLMEPLYWGMAGVLASYNFWEVMSKGKITPRFSLEMVGREGSTHFYIRTERGLRNIIESQIYAQYPQAEVLEVEDYVKDFPKVIPNKNWDLWGTDWVFVMPDAYPIKTYEKFEEDITGRMIDPIGGMAEAMGALGPGQHLWMQYVIEPLHETWKKDEENLIKKLAGRAVAEKRNVAQHMGEVITKIPAGIREPIDFSSGDKEEEMPLEFRLTPVEKEILKGVEANLGLNHFKTKVRMIYLGKREGFTKSNVSNLSGAFKQFNDLNLNNFKPNDRSKTYANYFFRESRVSFRKRLLYNRYKNRNMDGENITLSVRELATLFHFPDMDVQTPSVSRIDSKTGTAPSNLPVS